MMASIEGPKVAEFPFAKACQMWNNIRNRKINLNFDKLLNSPSQIEDDEEDMILME